MNLRKRLLFASIILSAVLTLTGCIADDVFDLFDNLPFVPEIRSVIEEKIFPGNSSSSFRTKSSEAEDEDEDREDEDYEDKDYEDKNYEDAAAYANEDNEFMEPAEGMPEDQNPEPADTPASMTAKESSRRGGDWKVLSFSVPSGSDCREADGMALLTMPPGEEYRRRFREVNSKLGASDKEIEDALKMPLQYMTVEEDAGKAIKWLYSNEIETAEQAAEACWHDYVVTGYEQSSAHGPGRCGRVTENFAGRDMYVIWHSGSSELVSWQEQYECFMDGPTGTIIRFRYMICDAATENAVREVLGSVRFLEAFEEPAPAPSLEWYSYTMTSTDSEGYVLRQNLRMSPWISENNPELLKAAWDEISRGKLFPSNTSLNLLGNRIMTSGKWYVDYDEVVYTVGTIEASNETPGFDITKDNPRSFSIALNGARKYMSMRMFFGNEERLYYSVPQDDGGMFGSKGGGWNPINGKMQSNRWGPVPFVIALVLDKTPNHPAGNPSTEECVFKFGENAFVLPATW